ncbi:hypothetical protein PLIIFM63780_001476 [Purpureocillium lilacinum]|nr:hypothetical protein PLIIFM63780_001476 [Purpureocillium lilacinum]
MASGDGTRLFWVQLGLMIPCIVFSGLRIYVRAFITRSFAPDDWAIMLATTLFLISSAVTMRGATYGAIGQGDDHPGGGGGGESAERIVTSMKGIYICAAIYSLTSLAIRVSVCLFLLRIVTRRAHRQVLHALLAVSAAASAAYFFTVLLQCSPPSFFWNRVRYGGGAAHGSGGEGGGGGAETGRCIRHQAVTAVAMVHATVSALSAWVMGLLPMVMLWNVRMETRTKVTVIALLGMSMVAGITIIVRMTTLKFIEDSTPAYFKSTMDTAMWSSIEPSVGIIAASIPTLRPLFKRRSRWSSRARPKTPASVRGAVTTIHRSSRPQWVELAPRQSCRDEEAAQVSGSGGGGATSSSNSDKPVWITTVEKGESRDEAALGGITIHTAIEVISHRRE